jgi:hypothetical protein
MNRLPASPPAKIKDYQTGRILHHIDKYHMHKEDLAGLLWGRPVKAYRTNRKGAGFYEAKRNAGFIIEGRAFSRQELDALHREGFRSRPLRLFVQELPEGTYVIGKDTLYFNSRQSKDYPRNPKLGRVHWILFPIFIFEYKTAHMKLHSLTGIDSTFFDDHPWLPKN